MINNNSIWIFIHIPKTAGSSLNSLIERNYSFDSRCKYSEDPKEMDAFLSLSDLEKSKKKFFSGHMAFGLHELLPFHAESVKYITILRDPIERVISHYYYVLRSPYHHLYKKVTTNNLSMKDYILNKVSIELNNGQTRLLSGNKGLAGSVEFGKCSQEMLEVAKQNIDDHFSVVGLTERFDETLLLMKKEGILNSIYYVKRNVTKNRIAKESVPQDVLNTIEEYNKLDIELYNYAKGIFEKRCNEISSLEKRKVLLLNRYLGPIYHKMWALHHKLW